MGAARKIQVQDEPLVKKEVVMEFLNVKRTWLYEAIKIYGLPYYNLGRTGGKPDYRFLMSEIRLWREQRKEN